MNFNKIFWMLIAITIFVWLCGCNYQNEYYSDEDYIDEPFANINDIIMSENDFVAEQSYKYVFDESQDLQLPELPTGCEATALTTLLRMNGIEVTKLEIADAMPKNYEGRFVYSFFGDPYSTEGWACMAPCSVNLANEFLENSDKKAKELTGTKLSDLPLPSAVWVTIDLGYPVSADIWQDGYLLFHNPHCLVVTDIVDGMVKVVDPLVGITEYEFDNFEFVYNTLGSQAVYIDNV